MLPPSCAASFAPERQLGEGGYGTVWLARQRKLDRAVVVKVLHAAAAADEAQRRRFRDEARVTARLSHPSIVEVVDLDVESDAPWIAFEYLPGRSLAARLDADGRLPVDDAMDIALQIAGALHAAHQAGVLHRDVKPANILGGEGGAYKLADFGIAWFAGHRTLRTEAGVVLGTPAYMAPEYIRGEAGPRADLYALGCVMFEMLAGRPPMPGRTPLEQLAAHLAPERPDLAQVRPDAPRGLCALVARLIALDPAARPASGEEVEAALRALKAGEPVPTPARPTARTLLRSAEPRSIAVVPHAPHGARRLAPWLALLAGGAIGALAIVARPPARPVATVVPVGTPPASAAPSRGPEPSPAPAEFEPDEVRQRRDVEAEVNALVDRWNSGSSARGELEGLIAAGGVVELAHVAGLGRHAERAIAADTATLGAMVALDRHLVGPGDTRSVVALSRVRVLAYRFHWSRRIERLVRPGGGDRAVPAVARGAPGLIEPYAANLHEALRRINSRRGKARLRLSAVLQSIVDVKRGAGLMPWEPHDKPLAEKRLTELERMLALSDMTDAEDLALIARAAWRSGGEPLADAAEYLRALDAAMRLDTTFIMQSSRQTPKRDWPSTWVQQHLGPRKEAPR